MMGGSVRKTNTTTKKPKTTTVVVDCDLGDCGDLGARAAAAMTVAVL